MTRPVPAVRLEPFGRGDFERLISWVPDEVAMFQWAGPIFEWPLTETQLDRYMLPARPWRVGTGGRPPAPAVSGAPFAPPPDTPPTRLIWTAFGVDAAGSEAVGHVELNSIDLRHRSATLSRVLVGSRFRGRGYARAMIAAVLPVAFDELRLHRVDLVAFEHNEPALRCYRSLGFTREGVLRDVRFVGGSFLSSVVMSMLEGEWRTHSVPPGAPAPGS